MILLASAMSESVALAPLAMALIPIPIAQGVFGITLTTLAFGPRLAEILSESMPAMMLSTMDEVFRTPRSAAA
jgi:hypothetical protein